MNNRKKYFFLAALSIGLIFVLSACSNGNSAAGDEDKKMDNARRPDFGQPERPADLSGLVKSMSGNQATILKLDRPARTDSETGGQARAQAGQNGSGAASGRTGNFALGMGGGRMMAGGRPGETSAEDRSALIARMKEMSSGEVVVTIPVGIRMLKPDTSAATGGQPSMTEASLADINADKMVRVWLDQSISDRQIAEFVMIN